MQTMISASQLGARVHKCVSYKYKAKRDLALVMQRASLRGLTLTRAVNPVASQAVHASAKTRQITLRAAGLDSLSNERMTKVQDAPET